MRRVKKDETRTVLAAPLKEAIRLLSKLESMQCIGCAGPHADACPARRTWGVINSLSVSLNRGTPP